jgi:hypothetical protein
MIFEPFFENLSRKFKFHSNPTKTTFTLHEDVSTFLTISLEILLRMRKVLHKSCKENQNTYKVVQIWPGLFVCKQVTVCPGHIWTTLYFIFNKFFPKLHRLWNNIEKCGGKRGGNKWRHNMAHTRCSWIGTATYTYAHAQAHAPKYPHARTHARTHIINNTYCFSTATIIRERASILSYTYIKKKKLSRDRPEQAHGRSGRLRPRIFLTFGTRRW